MRDFLPQAEAELKFRALPDDEMAIVQLIEKHEVKHSVVLSSTAKNLPLFFSIIRSKAYVYLMAIFIVFKKEIPRGVEKPPRVYRQDPGPR